MTQLSPHQRREALHLGACIFQGMANHHGPDDAERHMTTLAADAARGGAGLGWTVDDVTTWRVDYDRAGRRGEQA